MGLGTWAFYVKMRGVDAVPGWTTIMILVALGSSVQLLVIGILGAYVGRIYEEVQRRPLYAVAKEVNFVVRAECGPTTDVRDREQPPPGLSAETERGRGGKAP
jgi:hypothetical protein